MRLDAVAVGIRHFRFERARVVAEQHAADADARIVVRRWKPGSGRDLRERRAGGQRHGHGQHGDHPGDHPEGMPVHRVTLRATRNRNVRAM
jgi:hypothetical protein